jgi:hypothetical protein
MRPKAMGKFVVLSSEGLSESQNRAIAGNKKPVRTPISMAAKIQTVRYLSRNLRRGEDGIFFILNL